MKHILVLFLAGVIPVVWLALLFAPYLYGGLSNNFSQLTFALNHPFQIQWVKDSPRTILFFLGIYAMGIAIYYSTKKNYRRGEEHGSAKWGSVKKSIKNMPVQKQVMINFYPKCSCQLQQQKTSKKFAFYGSGWFWCW